MSCSYQDLIECFKYFDESDSGELDQFEMYKMGEYLGISINKMSNMIKEIDVDNDKTISLQEWIN